MSQNKNNYAAGFDTSLGRMILLAEDVVTKTYKTPTPHLVGLGFAGTKMNDEAVIAYLSRQLACQDVLTNPEKLKPLAHQIISQPDKVPMSLRGTDFQKTVWRRLMEIPVGTTTTYGNIADYLQTAPRAVGSAVGKNPISLLVPCHRVIGSTGHLHGYRWGLAVKKCLLAAECAPVSVTL